MKKIIYIFAVIGLMASCSLEREDYTEIYPDTIFKTEKDLELAVNGLYYDFNMGDWNGVYRPDYSGYQIVSELTTDATWCNWGWESDEYYYHQWTAASGSVQAEFYDLMANYNFLSKARIPYGTSSPAALKIPSRPDILERPRLCAAGMRIFSTTSSALSR